MMEAAAARRFGYGEIRCFTGLRGCAAVMVMLYHFTLNMHDAADTLSDANTMTMARQFLLHGYLWVDLFFVLSGFVMAYSQPSLCSGGYRARSHVTFLMSRFARIYPLYAIVLIESACFAFWRAPTDFLQLTRTFALNVMMVQAWGLAPSMEGAAWSISTEWAAYLVFPFLLMAVVSAHRWIATIVAAGALLVILYLSLSSGPFGSAEEARNGPLDIYSHETIAPLFRCLSEFTLGLVAYRLARFVTQQPRNWTGPLAMLTGLAIAGGLCLPGSDFCIVGLFVVLLVSLAPEMGLMADLLGARVPYLLVQWSYSIYLLHDNLSHPAASFRAMLADHVPGASLIATVLVVCFVIAAGAATFTWVERPLRKWLLESFRPWRGPKPNTPAAAMAIPGGPGRGYETSR